MSTRGVLDCNVAHGSVNGKQFYKIIQKTPFPYLMSYNGTNSHSIIVMDNASIHHVEGVKEMITEVGTLQFYFHLIMKKQLSIMKSRVNFKRWTLNTLCCFVTQDCQHWIGDNIVYV